MFNANSTRLSEIIADRNETPARPMELTESRILIDNTPTPFLKSKKKNRVVLTQQDQNEFRVSGKPFVVQNTPNQINNKRVNLDHEFQGAYFLFKIFTS